MMQIREEYLQAIVAEYRRDMRKLGIKLPPLHISVGHTGQGRTIGVTYGREHSPDGVNQVYVSPTIKDTDEVIAVVGHECVHVSLDCEGGHGKRFSVIARQLGFIKPYTQSAAGPLLIERTKEIKAKVGRYRHPGFKLCGEKPTKCVLR